jgi:18S rRNA (adenine1779-N6/adenine1780-N6)-dimethyltransferase
MTTNRDYSRRRTKALGQNFLISPNVAQRIVELANLDPDHDVVLEIGPGAGNLTRHLVKHAREVIAIEIDPDLAEQTKKACDGHGNLKVLVADILKTDFPPCTKVVANLPYVISSPLTFHLISNRRRWTECILMFQKEFAERLYAPPGNSEYSRLSAGVQYYLTVEKLMSVSRRNFTPQPKVDSLVVRFRQIQPPPKVPPEYFLATPRGIFPYKNRTLRNALLIMLRNHQLPWETLCRELDVGDIAARRVRTLTPPEIESIAQKLASKGWLDQES